MNNIIVAMTQEGVIGKDGALPWRLPEDMRLFKEITTGRGRNAVIMGRTTWDGMPKKPLPGRMNIVLTHRPLGGAPCVAARSLEQALMLTEECEQAFIIGGAQVYAAALDTSAVQRLYVSWVHGTYDGDTRFPALDWSQWHEISRMPYDGFDACVYARR